MSGLLLRAMMVFERSGVTYVFSCAGAASSAVQPSSKASRTRLSNRPVVLDCAPRPRGEGPFWMALGIARSWRQTENKTRTLGAAAELIYTTVSWLGGAVHGCDLAGHGFAAAQPRPGGTVDPGQGRRREPAGGL